VPEAVSAPASGAPKATVAAQPASVQPPAPLSSTPTVAAATASTSEPARREPTPPRELLIGGTRLAIRRFQQGGECSVDIDLVAPSGTPRDAALGRELETLSVEYAMGPWEPGVEPEVKYTLLFAPHLSDRQLFAVGMGAGSAGPLAKFAIRGPKRKPVPRTAASLGCPPGEAGVRILSTDVTLSTAGSGIAALQLVGYSRFNRAAAFVRIGCYLLDTTSGTVVSSREGLSAETLRRLSVETTRAYRHDTGSRSARADVGIGTQLCPDAAGLGVQFQPGELDPYTSTVGPRLTLPKELAALIVPAETALGRALR
jgi:hypothetical protein